MIKRMLLLSLVMLFLAGCYGGDPWVESIEIEVHDDLSSVVHFIVLESSESISKEKEDGEKSMVEIFEDIFSETCEISSLPYMAAANAEGFSGAKEFQNKTDLVYAFSCIPYLSQSMTVQPLRVLNDYWGTSYELEIDICNPAFIRNLQITLPGKIARSTPIVMANADYMAITSYPTDDTVKWNVRLKDPNKPPQEPSKPEKGAVCTSPSIPPVIKLIAQARKSTIKIEWITTLCFGLLTLFFGGGAIWRLFEKSKKTQ